MSFLMTDLCNPQNLAVALPVAITAFNLIGHQIRKQTQRILCTHTDPQRKNRELYLAGEFQRAIENVASDNRGLALFSLFLYVFKPKKFLLTSACTLLGHSLFYSYLLYRHKAAFVKQSEKRQSSSNEESEFSSKSD